LYPVQKCLAQRVPATDPCAAVSPIKGRKNPANGMIRAGGVDFPKCLVYIVFGIFEDQFLKLYGCGNLDPHECREI